ncbi:MAG: antibiotic hydrolase, partial [Herminiimonas sp.]|nr:antibiotic hydrolase [Herminiimonas sp.]
MSLLNFMKLFGRSRSATKLPPVPADGSEDRQNVGFEVTVLRDVMVTMRDGVRLATDIYLPARDGKAISQPFPVILERTPYSKNIPSRSERTVDNEQPMPHEEVAGFFVRRGYVVIYQDCRGRHKSEGEFVKYTSEGNDGYDTCAWIVAQSWCNGRIGTKGLSYAAHTQAALGSLNAPGVVAMFMDSGGFSNAYQGGIRQGGAFELKQATWALKYALESPGIRDDKEKLAAMSSIDIKEWANRIHLWEPGNSPLSHAPEYEEYLFDQWQRGIFDEYWKQAGLYAEGFYTRFCDAAIVHMSSWYDPYPRTATDNYIGLSRLKRGPICLILGPWTHGNRSLSYAGDVDFGPEATLDGNLADDFLSLRLKWFDRWLKGNDSQENSDPNVRLFVMGGGSGRKNAAGRMDHGGRWRVESDWPVPGTCWTPHYFHPNGLLSTEKPQANDASLAYDYDPRNPVPTIGGAVTSGEPLMFGGAFDQRETPAIFGAQAPYRPLAERPDVLVFQTPPLEEDIELTGPIKAILWISSNCPDTDFTFKLIDVHPANLDYPEGYAMNLTDGILRARYRDSWEKPVLMT